MNGRIAKKTGFPPSDSCFRWNETAEDTLWWKTNTSRAVEYPVKLLVDPSIDPNKTHYLKYLVMKSASQFFGGMDQDALMGGEYGSGGFIGTTMSFNGASSCTFSLRKTRVLVRQADYHSFSAAPFIRFMNPFVNACGRSNKHLQGEHSLAFLSQTTRVKVGHGPFR